MARRIPLQPSLRSFRMTSKLGGKISKLCLWLLSHVSDPMMMVRSEASIMLAISSFLFLALWKLTVNTFMFTSFLLVVVVARSDTGDEHDSGGPGLAFALAEMSCQC